MVLLEFQVKIVKLQMKMSDVSLKRHKLFLFPQKEKLLVLSESNLFSMVMDEINDPCGMIGVRLEMEGTLITGSKTIITNTLRCVERAGLEIMDIVLQPLAAGELCLIKG